MKKRVQMWRENTVQPVPPERAKRHERLTGTLEMYLCKQVDNAVGITLGCEHFTRVTSKEITHA
jgi:hypothetical protein